jgi:predicted nucleic acid-binding protein
MYIDTCAIVKLYFPEPESAAVQKAVLGCSLVSSEIILTEFASAAARKVREGSVSRADAEEALALLRSHIDSGSLETVKIETSAFDAAIKMLFASPPNIPLRTLDAVHLSVCREQSLFPLLTLDKVMLSAAAHFKIPVLSVSLR